MKSVDTTSCLAHVLVCVNRRPDSSMPCCSNGDAEIIYDTLRAWLEKNRLLTRIWLTRTECMGWCHTDGATIAFYPENEWYRAVTAADCPVLIERHLQPLLDRAATS